MGRITLHTPRYFKNPVNEEDRQRTTDFEVDNILHVEAVLTSDQEGTKLYMNGVDGSTYCSESADEINRMIEENKSVKTPAISVAGNAHFVDGDHIEQNGGIMFWHKCNNFKTGAIAGWITGIATSYIASYLWTNFPIKF
jgi:hypothetical protein